MVKYALQKYKSVSFTKYFRTKSENSSTSNSKYIVFVNNLSKFNVCQFKVSISKTRRNANIEQQVMGSIFLELAYSSRD
jgi:hypothetical protein